MLDRHQHKLPRLLQGLAPFGADLAVLVYSTALEGASPRPPSSLAKTATMSGVSASDAIEASTELQHERPELKIFTWAHEEIAADALSITGGRAVPAHRAMQAVGVHEQRCPTCMTLCLLSHSAVSLLMRFVVLNLPQCCALLASVHALLLIVPLCHSRNIVIAIIVLAGKASMIS